MIALDTNLLVYAHRSDSPFHAEATRAIEGLATGATRWALPWPCLHEFVSVTTNPRIFKLPSPLELALKTVRSLCARPNVHLLAEGDGYWDCLESLALTARLQGAAIHDARIAALCIFHGVSELWSADRDFSRFPGLRVRNPLLDPG